MSRLWRNSMIGVAAWLFAALPGTAGTVTGVVHNGTTGKAAPGVTVSLIQLQSGMQPVADMKANASGAFQFDNPGIGQQPMLLQAHFQGVDYFSPIPPGQPNQDIDINVYEPTTDASAFHVVHSITLFEPKDGDLLVGEIFDIQNQSTPPKAYYRPKGSFEFQLPKGAEMGEVDASGPDGMPVTQGPVDEGNGRYAIIFPFRPGDNRVRVSFKLGYSGEQAALKWPSLYPVATAMLLAPPEMKVVAEGFSPAGNEHGLAVYSRSALKAGATMVVSLSGTGPMPSDTSQDQGQGSSTDSGSNNGVTTVAQALPPRLDSLRWTLIGGFGALFILGAFFLWWRSRTTAVPAPAAAGATAAVAAPPVVPAPATPAATVNTQPSLRESVEDIKETLFRLELRHQAGTLTEEDYREQRQRLEKALRDLVKG